MCDWIIALWIKLWETWVFIKVLDMSEHLKFIPVIMFAVVYVMSPVLKSDYHGWMSGL